MIHTRSKFLVYLFISLFLVNALPVEAMFEFSAQQKADNIKLIHALGRTGGSMVGAIIMSKAGIPHAPQISSLAVIGLQNIVPACSKQWQQGLYGHEDVSDNTKKMVCRELEKLNSNYKNVPIKKKNRQSFTLGSFDAVETIVYPTNNCIYVDEDLLSKLGNDEAKLFFIQAALLHYDNNTFMKLLTIKVPFDVLNVMMTYIATQKAKQITDKSLQLSERPIIPSLCSFSYRGAGDIALIILIDKCVSFACNKSASILMNRYFRTRQREFDRGVAGKNPTNIANKIVKPFEGELFNSKIVNKSPLAEGVKRRALNLIEDDENIKKLIGDWRVKLDEAAKSNNPDAVWDIVFLLGQTSMEYKVRDNAVFGLALEKLVHEEAIPVYNKTRPNPGRIFCTIV